MRCVICQQDASQLWRLPVLSPFAVRVFEPTGTIPQIHHYRVANNSPTPIAVPVLMNELSVGDFCQRCAETVNSLIEQPAEDAVPGMSALAPFNVTSTDAAAATRWVLKTLILQGASQAATVDPTNASFLRATLGSSLPGVMMVVARSEPEKYAMPIQLAFGSTDGHAFIGALGLPSVCFLLTLGTSDQLFKLATDLVVAELRRLGGAGVVQMWPQHGGAMAWPPTTQVSNELFPSVIRGIKNALQSG